MVRRLRYRAGASISLLAIDARGTFCCTYAALRNFAHFSMLWTSANSFHCPSTLCRPRSVKRLSRLLLRMLPNTGSTVAKRLPYSSRPSALSMRARMFCACVSLDLRVNTATCRVFVVSVHVDKLVSRHRQISCSSASYSARSGPVFLRLR